MCCCVLSCRVKWKLLWSSNERGVQSLVGPYQLVEWRPWSISVSPSPSSSCAAFCTSLVCASLV